MNKEQLEVYKAELAEIDHKLKNKTTYKEGQIHKCGFRLPGEYVPNYNTSQLTLMWSKKNAIINLLIKEGHISNEGRKQYLLAENDIFTPEIT